MTPAERLTRVEDGLVDLWRFITRQQSTSLHDSVLAEGRLRALVATIEKEHE